MTLNIFTARDNKLEPSKDKESMKESFDQMKDLLKQKFPRLDVSVNIFWIPANLIHDRYIFTNFYYINAGAGFILYDSNGKLKKQKSNNLQVFLIKVLCHLIITKRDY